MNNRAFASSMSMHTLRDRQGQQPDTTAAANGTPGDSAAWARAVGSSARRDGAGTLQNRDNSFLVHAGSDVLRFSDGGEGSIRAGVMGTAGYSNNTSYNGQIGARGNVTGYNVGLYGTWYGHRDILTGPYADTWLMAGHYDNEVAGQGLATEKYSSHTLSGSLEGGYAFKVYEAPRRRVFVIPQAQVVMQRYSGGTHLENTGTVVSDPSATTTTTRIGVRVHGDIEHLSGKSQLRPFVEVNWLRGPSDQTMLFNGEAVREALPANRAEAKLGIQGNVGKRTSMYGHISGQTGAQGYRAGAAQVGVKHNW
jgi:outer membrane autotransporter protein